MSVDDGLDGKEMPADGRFPAQHGCPVSSADSRAAYKAVSSHLDPKPADMFGI